MGMGRRRNFSRYRLYSQNRSDTKKCRVAGAGQATGNTAGGAANGTERNGHETE